MSLYLSNLNRLTIKNVFTIHQNKSGKIDVEGFENILKMIDFEIKEEHKKKIIKNLFRYKSEITFDQYLKIFDLDLEGYTSTDVKNAFKVLAKENDSHVKMNVIKEIISELDIKETEKKFLLNHLTQFNDKKDEFNFIELLKLFNM